jgi:two-component system chemotaxis response regulator CheB
MYSTIVVDDSPVVRKVLEDHINNIEDFKVVAVAKDAFEARDLIKEYEPDLVTIDINMPKMDGVQFLKNLMRLHPMPAVIISSNSARDSEAFEVGAVGFVSKPAIHESNADFGYRIKDALLKLTFLLKRYQLKKPKVTIPKDNSLGSNSSLAEPEFEKKLHPDEVLDSSPTKFGGEKVIAIGSSTGGIEALISVFKDLPSNLPPILIAQHIPYGFSSSFAQRLNDHSSIIVYEAKDNQPIKKSHAYLAPGNKHLTIEKRGNQYYTKLLDAPKVSRHKPSVDILFRSVNNVVGSSALAIIMTGMGDDGSIGIKELYDNGAHTIAQSEETCVVFGMPDKAIKAGAIKEIVDLNKLSKSIRNFR